MGQLTLENDIFSTPYVHTFTDNNNYYIRASTGDLECVPPVECPVIPDDSIKNCPVCETSITKECPVCNVTEKECPVCSSNEKECPICETQKECPPSTTVEEKECPKVEEKECPQVDEQNCPICVQKECLAMTPPSVTASDMNSLISENYGTQPSYLCPNGCPTIDESKKRGKGYYFISYGRNEQEHQKSLTETINFVKMLKSLSPNVHCAIATPLPVPEESLSLFSNVIIIPEKHLFQTYTISDINTSRRQLFTRALYFGATPFEVTVVIDAFNLFCDPKAPVDLLNMFKKSNADMAMSAVNIGLFRPSGWTIFYRWNWRTKLVLRDWIEYFLSDSIFLPDDQTPLAHAIHKAIVDNRLIFDRISSNNAFVARCYAGDGTAAIGKCDYKASIVLNAPIRLIHSNDNHLCLLLNGENNEYSYKNRVYVYDKTKPSKQEQEQMVFSKESFDSYFSPASLPNPSWDMSEKPNTGLFWSNCTKESLLEKQPTFCGLS
ncbi:hypothetical protein WA158_003631 [Blastocystis sp. Blastoise]